MQFVSYLSKNTVLSDEAIVKLMKTANINLEQQQTSNIKHILTIMKKITDNVVIETTTSPIDSTQQPTVPTVPTTTSTSGPTTQTSESTTQGTASVTIKFITLLSVVVIGFVMN